MPYLKNIGLKNLSFTTGSKDGEPVIVDLKVGESKSIDLKSDDPQIVARVNSQQVVVGRVAASASRGTPRANRVEDPAPDSANGS